MRRLVRARRPFGRILLPTCHLNVRWTPHFGFSCSGSCRPQYSLAAHVAVARFLAASRCNDDPTTTTSTRHERTFASHGHASCDVLSTASLASTGHNVVCRPSVPNRRITSTNLHLTERFTTTTARAAPPSLPQTTATHLRHAPCARGVPAGAPPPGGDICRPRKETFMNHRLSNTNFYLGIHEK